MIDRKRHCASVAHEPLHAASSALIEAAAMTLKDIEAKLCSPGARFELEVVETDRGPLRSWKNQHRSLTDLARMARAAYTDREFLVLEDVRVTYDGWFRAFAQLSAHLVATGVNKGDRVAVAMRNLST